MLHRIKIMVVMVALASVMMSEAKQSNSDDKAQQAVNDEQVKKKIQTLAKESENALNNQKFGKASRKLSRLASLEPDNQKVQVNLVESYININQLSEARKVLDKSLKTKNVSNDLLLQNARLLVLEKQSQKALEQYYSIIESSPKESAAWIGAANIHYEWGETDKGDKALDQYWKLLQENQQQ